MRLRAFSMPLFCLLAAIAVTAGPASAAKQRTEHGVNRAKLAKQAKRIVEERNAIEVRRISRCGPRRLKRGRLDYSRWICEWRAEGKGAGGVPYHCAGKARWKRKKRSWRVDPCANRLQPRAPLLDTPNPHPMFGFNDDWGHHLLPAGSAHAHTVGSRLRTSGANVARMNILWSAVEPSRGTHRWTTYDTLNAQFTAAGVRPLWVVIGAPCWAQKGACSSSQAAPPAAGNVDAYGRFAAAVARRYPNSVGVEIWNEPNYPLFWGGETPDPRLYAEMLRSAADQVHEEAPGMPVVSAGLSPHSDNSPDAFGYREFIERLYELGAAQRADAIGIHPYPGVGPNDDYLGDALIQLGKYQIEMRQAGKPAPMWATEFGISTTGRHAFAPEHQARALPELYELFRRVDRVDVAIIHRLVDASHAGGSEAGYGVLHDGLGLKPALCGLALLRGLGC